MTDDVPFLSNTVAWSDVRASIALRRESLLQAKLDPDEGASFERIWAEQERDRKRWAEASAEAR
jgi:hypothetical protein